MPVNNQPKIDSSNNINPEHVNISQKENKGSLAGRSIKIIALASAVSLVVTVPPVLGYVVLLASGLAFYEAFVVARDFVKDKVYSITEDQASIMIDEKGMTPLYNRVKALQESDPAFKGALVVKRLAQATDYEVAVFKQLQDEFQLEDSDLKSILNGAHVYLDDGGESYDQWKDLKDENQNILPINGHSSHPSDAAQYRLSGPFFKEFLFSNIVKEDKGKEHVYTWFQLENSPGTLSSGFILRHVFVDFVKYKITGLNQGPYGASEHTDKKPVILHKTADYKFEPLDLS